jgi:hypothetical protein
MSKTERFIKKFPKSEENDNCLADYACPKCGSRGDFEVEVYIVVTMSDMGTESDGGDSEFTGRYMKCCACAHEGKSKDFWHFGLDDGLAYKRQNED